jgi:hypothetical protein
MKRGSRKPPFLRCSRPSTTGFAAPRSRLYLQCCCETLMCWWWQEGGDAVSFGSDAHQPLRVGEHFDVVVDIAEAAGFRPGRDRYDFWRR